MTIRKCSEVDREEILDFVFEEPAFNLFLIGDIEAFGFAEPFQEIWACRNEKEQVNGVLLRYNESFIPYWKDEAFNPQLMVDVITHYVETVLMNSPFIISGKDTMIKSIQLYFPKLTPKPTFFCELNSKERLQKVDKKIKIATEEDAERIFELMETIDEFSISVPIERIAHKIRTKTGRIYYIEGEHEQMLSVAQTTAENSKSAMIVGVATRKEYRGQGLMSQCLTQLCSDLLDEKKSLCLFYDNPSAGKVYHRVGFETIGQWIMLR